ncbi:MAG TPA: hypothetical protein VJ783_02080 [Pirellulales bacterium]|nr:hypothetical protein [Pirellulales bacterium]
MARQEHQREDLLREAVALVERAELRLPGPAEQVVVGFRRDGSASIFFGEEPVYQFNSVRELRRAYEGGLLFKAERGRLVSLRRQRVPGQVQLLRHDLNDDETCRFLAELTERVGDLRDHVRDGAFELVGQAPTGSDVVGRIVRWLESLELPPALASTPRVR